MIDTRPKLVPPLTAEELKHDAETAGVSADDSVKTDGDTHLPASESDHLHLPRKSSAEGAEVLLPPD